MNIQNDMIVNHYLPAYNLHIAFGSGLTLSLAWGAEEDIGLPVNVSVFEKGHPRGGWITDKVAAGAGLKPGGLIDHGCDADRVHAYFEACKDIERSRMALPTRVGSNGRGEVDAA